MERDNERLPELQTFVVQLGPPTGVVDAETFAAMQQAIAEARLPTTTTTTTATTCTTAPEDTDRAALNADEAMGRGGDAGLTSVGTDRGRRSS
jgi:hypothetical protein